MLIRFGVSNHLSIRDYQELSFVASSALDDLPHTMLKDAKGIKPTHFVPVIALYGANAAGKSNMLDALNFVRRSVLRSYVDWPDRKLLPHSPFRLDSNSANVESSYECDILISGVRYNYGFSLNAKTIIKEWLFFYPNGARTVLFHRDFQDISNEESPYYFGPSLKERSRQIWKTMASNSKILLLSAAGRDDLRHEQLTPVFDFFQEFLRPVLVSADRSESFLGSEIYESQIQEKLVSVLAEADFGIVGLDVSVVELDEKRIKFRDGMIKLMGDLLNQVDRQEFMDQDEYEITFMHRCEDGTEHPLSYAEESSGTKYLLSLLVPIISALESGATLIVDEITTHLHTKLSESILKLFTSPEINNKNAQFIFSTHDTNLLNLELLRRDEIWFAEKDKVGATQVYPLTDFKTRKTDNIEKGYLQGRFGAIPFPHDIAYSLVQ